MSGEGFKVKLGGRGVEQLVRDVMGWGVG